MSKVELHRNGTARIVVHTDFTNETVDEARAFQAQLIREGVKRYLVDLSKVKLISSAGVGFVATAHHSALTRGGKAVFFGLQPAVRDVLQVTGLLSLIKVTSLEEEAQELLKE